jgi:hypothetical protein
MIVYQEISNFLHEGEPLFISQAFASDLQIAKNPEEAGRMRS